MRGQDGRLIARFSSDLPGGNGSDRGSRTSYCILDCIFNEAENIYFVLDLVVWKGMNYA